MKIFYSPNKHGRRVNNTNTIRTTQLQSRQKHLKLDSNLDTRLAHNTLGKAKPKYSWQYFTILIFLVEKSFMKNLLITKSRDCRSDLVKGHASRPYSIVLVNIWLWLIEEWPLQRLHDQFLQKLHSLRDKMTFWNVPLKHSWAYNKYS